MRRILFVCLFALVAVPTYAQTHSVFIAPTPGNFEVYLAAALVKKHVPVAVVTQPEAATYTLKASEIEVVKESAGSKFARCMFAYCAGIEDKGSV